MTAKLAVTIGIGWYVVNEVDRLDRIILAVLVMVGSQAGIAIVQAATQHAIGLGWLQELRFAPNVPGVSIVATDEGVRWVRAYGLASHPNILGGCWPSASSSSRAPRATVDGRAWSGWRSSAWAWPRCS